VPSATPTPIPTQEPEPTPNVVVAPVVPAGPQPSFPVESSAVAIFEANCGTMLYEMNARTRMAPASLTKMMTLLVSVRSDIYPMNLVKPGISAVELKQKTRSSVMGLSPNLSVTIQDLYFGLMLPSGNDAAIALAQASGSYDGFVQSMNDTAAFYGLRDTNFTNPHGLDNPALYSTAYDLLVLERMMMEHPYAAWVASMPYYTTVHGDLGFNNGNKLLTSYPGTIGGKIGYTGDAGHTIAVTVERGGRRLDMVVLGSPVKFVEPMRLLDWAFNETSPAC
jgi:serine-type D-Ala-D-Ala carboxypeptidase (penicillin-binding protein 5/6)